MKHDSELGEGAERKMKTRRHPALMQKEFKRFHIVASIVCLLDRESFREQELLKVLYDISRGNDYYRKILAVEISGRRFVSMKVSRTLLAFEDRGFIKSRNKGVYEIVRNKTPTLRNELRCWGILPKYQPNMADLVNRLLH
jgi:hypothetical protein